MRILTLSLILAIGCSESAGPGAVLGDTREQADLLFLNGRVFIPGPGERLAEAVAVTDGLIVFVGKDDSAAMFLGPGTEVVDLEGRSLIPGLHDVHVHPIEARSAFAGTCLLDGRESNPERYIPKLRRCAPDQLATSWVLGFGHSIFSLLDAARLPVEILDEAIPDRPAIIMEETSHSVWVNSRALAAVGITDETPDPQGGVIVRTRGGSATGILLDAAGDLAMDFAWTDAPEILDLNYEGLLEAFSRFSSNGITSVSEGRTYWRRGFHKAWLRAERENTLTVRAVLALWAYPWMDDQEQIAELRSLYRHDPQDLLQISEVKLYSDGILINSTAAMLEPYLETVVPLATRIGLNYFSEERIAQYIRELDPVGFDFHIHAIGDRGVREALNAIGQAQWQGRHRITHLEVVAPADYPRFAALNVTADMQVAGAFSQPAAWSENEFLIGARSSPLIPLRDLYEAGARITLSSDWDVSTLNPFVAMEHALTRSPQALPSLEAVLDAYTINAAFALRQEERTGSIEVGKAADLVELDRDIFAAEPGAVGQTKVLATYLAGRPVFRR
jgi:predicted amidohydrolase YtcJ